MAPTFTQRKRSEFQALLKHMKEEDLLRKAEMLSAYANPDDIFTINTIKRTDPFGVLVVFRDHAVMEAEMPASPKGSDLDDIERMITVLQAYPRVSKSFYDGKRQAFQKEYTRYQHIGSRKDVAERERSRLENAVQMAGAEKEDLERENTERMRRIQQLEEDIAKCEEQLIHCRDNNAVRISEAKEAAMPLKADIEEDTARLRALNSEINTLHEEQERLDRSASPTTARLQDAEEKRLAGEQASLTGRLRISAERLKSLEEEISRLEEEDRNRRSEADIMDSLNRSRVNLEQEKDSLSGGTKMLENLNLKVQILGGRLESIEQDRRTLPEQKENMRIAALVRAEDLLNAWISSSEVLRRILNMDGVNASDLVEALFFASGPIAAAGEGACAYLDATSVSLNTVIRCGTQEEHSGFWNVIEII